MGPRRLRAGVGALLRIAVLAATGCAPARSPYALDYPMPAHLPVKTERYRLGNGLEVILSEDHAVPFVAVNLWCHVGSKDDPPQRAGLAHLCEHLMFEGSRHVAPYEHFTRLADVGAEEVNAWTNADSTWFHETVPSPRIETALWLESDRMASGAEMLDQAKLDSERKIVENELRENYEEEPYGMVQRYVWAALFPDSHPYHHPVIGDLGQLDAATLGDVRAFSRAGYAPSNCTLALVGDFEPSAVRPLLVKYFATIAGGAPLALANPAPLPVASEKRIVIEADVPRARVVIAWPVVPRFAPGATELEVGARALEGWLYREIVDDEPIATSVHVAMEPRALASVFEIVVELRPGVAAEAALGAIDRRLHEMRGPRFRYDRVQFALGRAQLLAGPLRTAERLESRAELLQLYNQDAGTPDYADMDLAARRGVLVEDVRKAYYDLLRWDRRVVALVVPRSGAPLAGRLASPP
jgi:predicted Zn-dependent peptidase